MQQLLLNQRWRHHRDSYRRPDEPINTSRYEVAELFNDTTPKQFVLDHHYSGSWPNARFRFGLYRGAALVGVAVYSHPMNDKVLTNVFPGTARDSVELGRFVLLDSVEGNGETWFLGRTFSLLRDRELRGVVSFSDPLPRYSGGRQLTPGHVGTIYQAHNGVHLGRSKRRTLHMLPNGQVFSDRAESKVRDGEKGWRYSAAILEELGADPCEGNRAAWLSRWLPRLTTSVRHPGNYRYAWKLNRRTLMVGAPQAYPKKGGTA